MPVTPNYVQLPTPANTGGLKVNTFEGSVNSQTVESQGVVLTDPINVGNGAAVAAISADALATTLLGLLTEAVNLGYNGATVDRLRTASAANLSAFSGAGVLLAAKPGEWSVAHTPAAATLATASKAAGGAGVRHVCTSIAFALAVDATHPQTAIQINLRDDATGAGTILWSLTLLKAAAEGISVHAFQNLNIVGSANKAMTLEFSAAGVTGSVESVSMTGYDVA